MKEIMELPLLEMTRRSRILMKNLKDMEMKMSWKMLGLITMF